MKLATTTLRLAAFAGVAVLAACAPEIEGRLYLEDVTEVAGGGKPIITQAQLRIPESSEDECKKGLEDLAQKLSAITPLSDSGACVEVDNSQFSQFTMDLPIIAPGTKLDIVYLATLTVAKVDDALGSGIALSLGMSRTLEDVQNAIGRGEDSGFTVGSSDKEQPKFVFTFENDGRDPAGLVPNYVFVDDEPGLPGAESTVSLDRRQSVKIQFSDVIAAYIAKAHSFAFATVYPGS